MTTLAVNVPLVQVGGDINELPIIASDIIYEGAAVGVVAATGHCRPLTSVDKFAGFAVEKCDNSAGSAAAKNIRIYRKGTVLLTVAGVVITDISQPVYATDDATFTMLPTGGVFVGFVRRFASTGVAEVDFDVTAFKDPYGDKVKQTLAASTLTLDAEDCAKYIFCTVDTTITLPATATALDSVTLVNMGPFGTVAIVVDPDNADKIAGPDIAPADGATVTNTKATARRGDLITLNSNAAAGPAITQMRGTWAAA